MFTLACEQVLHVRVSQSKRWTINFHQWENIVRPIKSRERWFFTEWNFIVLDADWLLLIRNDYYAQPYRWINLYTHVIKCCKHHWQSAQWKSRAWYNVEWTGSQQLWINILLLVSFVPHVVVVWYSSDKMFYWLRYIYMKNYIRI